MHISLQTDEEKTIDRHAGRLTAIVIIKLVVGGCALALAVYLEYEHELVGGHDNYIKIALDHLAAMFVLCSAIVDLYAIYGHRQTLLNFKVSGIDDSIDRKPNRRPDKQQLLLSTISLWSADMQTCVCDDDDSCVYVNTTSVPPLHFPFFARNHFSTIDP